MSDKPYRASATELIARIRRDRDQAVRTFLRTEHEIYLDWIEGRNVRAEVRDRMRGYVQGRTIGRQIGEALDGFRQEVKAHLRSLRDESVLAQESLKEAAMTYRASIGPK